MRTVTNKGLMSVVIIGCVITIVQMSTIMVTAASIGPYPHSTPVTRLYVVHQV
jgi:hypothetical protein